MDEAYDVLIVGAGPGGCSAAWRLAGMGYRVLVVDRETFPREKICGDGIAPRAVHALYQMGLRDQLEGRFQVIEGVRFYSSRGGLTEVRYPMGGHFPDHAYIVPRIKFDDMLVRQLRSRGVEVREDCEVIAPLPARHGRIPGVIVSSGGQRREIGARFIIAADGPSSVIGRKLHLLYQDPRYLGVSVRCYMRGSVDVGSFLEIYPEDAIMPCCGWIFKVDEDTVNVGVGAMLYAMRRKNMNLNRVFEDFCTGTRFAAAKLRSAEPVGKLRGAQLRVALRGSRPGVGNVLLVGDAASMTNPISGEGISYALESGKLAGESVLCSLESGTEDALYKYARSLKEKYDTYFRNGWMCIRWGNNPYVMNPLIWTTSRSERLGNKMGRYLMNVRRSDHPF
jgi:geranylgeranyl reductase family protein